MELPIVGSFRVKSPQKNEIWNGTPPDFDENLLQFRLQPLYL